MSDLPSRDTIFSIMVVYWALFIFSTIRSIWLYLESRGTNWNIAKIFCFLVPLIYFAHAGGLTYHYVKDADTFFIEVYEDQTPLTMILDSTPGYLFISTYILLVTFWITLCTNDFQTSADITSRVQFVYIMINVALYSIWIFLFVLICIPEWRVPVHTAEAAFTTIITLLVGVVFSVGGSRLYITVKKKSVLSTKRWRSARKIAYLTIFITIIFVIRAINIWGSYYILKSELSMYLVKTLSLIFLDIIPLIAIMIAIKPSPNTRTSTSNAEKLPLNPFTE